MLAKFGSHQAAYVDTVGLALRVGGQRGTASGFGNMLLVEFVCATHTITTPVATPLNSAVALRCIATPVAGDATNACCELVCSTSVCFIVQSPVRFELVGLRLRGRSGVQTPAGAAVTITGSSLTSKIMLSLLHFSTFDARALVIEQASGTLTASVFEKCTCTADGGALLIDASSALDVANCIFRGNSALTGNGGAIAVRSSSSLQVNATICEGNRALCGGCIYAAGAAKIQIKSSTIDSNIADNNGGGVCAVFSPLELLASLVSNNYAELDGGGLHLSTDVTSHIDSTVFISNRADTGVGGAFRTIDHSPNFTDCTFISNAANATKFGGLGLVSSRSKASYTKCTFDLNTPAGTNGRGNACGKGEYSATANDHATCKNCAIDAIALSSGTETCELCEEIEGGGQYADEFRIQCLVRGAHDSCTRSLPCALSLSLYLCVRAANTPLLTPPPRATHHAHRYAPNKRTLFGPIFPERRTSRTSRTRAQHAPRVA